MSIPSTAARVTYKRSGGINSGIWKQLRSFNLKPVKKIKVTFDPFANNTLSARNFLFHASSLRVQQTNPRCAIKTEILNDRQDPTINIVLNSGEKVLLKTANLTTLEVLQIYNQLIGIHGIGPETT